MDVHKRLRQLLNERGWTEYRLSKKCGLSESTLAICNGFGITLSQFFAEDEMVELTPELKNLFDKWISLTPEQKDAIYRMVDAFDNS